MVMKNKTAFVIFITILIAAFTTAPVYAVAPSEPEGSNPDIPDISTFSDQVENGSTFITGIYSSDHFAYPVVQQPSSNAGYIATEDDIVTQFQMANQFGSIGMIAHNYLAGSEFFDLNIGDEIDVVYGNGETEIYVIVDLRSYQALSPNSPYSSFVNLASPSVTLSVTQVFYETYGIAGRLILQTCIEESGNESWGRLFVIALPEIEAQTILAQIEGSL
jgi:hypothetical protein